MAIEIGRGLAIEVTVVDARPEFARIVDLELPAGATLAQALAASGLVDPGDLQAGRVCAGLHGREQAPDAALSSGDRVEIYRPLQIGPKEARRLRAERRKP